MNFERSNLFKLLIKYFYNFIYVQSSFFHVHVRSKIYNPKQRCHGKTKETDANS